jgi:signal transduction histidine kinase
MLFKEDYQLDLAESGWQCLSYLETQEPDLILLDVMMPGLSGYDVCRRLKSSKDYQHIPIVLLTALKEREHILTGLEAGADEFVSKPVSGPELRARVKNLLRMKQMHDDLQRTLEFRQDLTRFLVHDMRNPLISIRLACELARPSAGPALTSTFDQILGEVQTLNGYIEEMLVAAALEGSAFELQLSERVLAELVGEWLESPLPWQGVEIRFQDRSEGLHLQADWALVRRVLENLLGNAVKYGMGRPIEIHLDRGPETAIVRVIDQGQGVPEEYRERIWEKHGTAPLRKPGSRQFGLGLYFSRLVAEAHGGRLEMTENVPQGSIFTLTLPLAQPGFGKSGSEE